uniref:Uncharacterized protein n=1 Tax=viral metagenome TaxID=1070528 RepID=A0A6M3K7B6_9ZZZZ
MGEVDYAPEVVERIKREAKTLRLFEIDPDDHEGLDRRDVLLHIPAFMADYHILPTSGAVVDAETVEACAESGYAASTAGRATAWDWEQIGDESRDACRRFALAVLEAADITVADEVVEVGEDDCDDPIPAQLRVLLPGDEEYSFLDFDPGDTLYIVRAVTADCHSKEG